VAEIRAEMVANVWRVLVRPGDAVEAGAAVAILESMKMEIPVESPMAGVVTRVLVEEGAVVQEGDVVAVVE
jgi:acetyl-CoA carboxylase biotin carboxyl carrier protein